MIRSARRIAAAGLMLAAAIIAVVDVPSAAGEGASTICITYRVTPARRAEIRGRFATILLPRLQAWCATSPGAEVSLLEATTAQTSGAWDFLVLLRLASSERLSAWWERERTMPAGLLPEEHEGIEEIHSSLVESLAEARAPIGPHTLVLARYYGHTDPEQYPDYVRAYLAPELDAWRGSGMIDGYAVLVNPFPQGRAWDILLLQYYRTDEDLSRREDVRGATIDSLRKNPAWIMLHDAKSAYRTSSEPENVAVIARPVIAGSTR